MQKFLVVVERTAGNYSAYAPDLPGCVATGSSLEETRRNMHEAIELHIQGLRDDQLPVPEPSSVAEFVEVALELVRSSAREYR